MLPLDEMNRRLDALDPALLAAVPTQSHEADRRSWLAVQRVARRREGGYAYLEIGSHLGGSLQQHVIDPRCVRIFSIDKRPTEQPDDRGSVYRYDGNTTARMLDNLRALSAEGTKKVVCIDSDARDIDPARIDRRPDFCFIDGEHTAPAVQSDFEFCLRVAAPDAAICFHDDSVVYPALGRILDSLRAREIPHRALKLGAETFGIFLRGCAAPDDPVVRELACDGPRWIRKRKLARVAERWLPGWFLAAAKPVGSRLIGR
jgi:hypothetical protein